MINYNRLHKNPINKAFVDDIYGATIQHPFSDWLRVFLNNEGRPIAAIELTDGHVDGEMTLGFIQSLEKGYGYGSYALSLFMKIATRHNMVIHLTANRCGADGLSQANLKRWYKRHGFHFERNGRDGVAYCISQDWLQGCREVGDLYA